MPPLEIRYLSGHDIDRLAVGPDMILDATERALVAQGRDEVVLEPREHLVPDPAFDGHFNLLRAYVAPLDVAGVKVVGDYHGNYKRGLPSELGLLTLYDPRTGVPRAILDATAITEWRTGGVTALGGRHFAQRGARVLGHVGARGTAFANVTLLNRVHDYDEIRVTSARPQSRMAFAERLQKALGKAVRVCDTIEETVRGADVVVEATRLVAPEPILRTEWLDDATLVMPYGTMSAVELSLTTIMDKVYVDDWGQCKSGRFGALRAHVDAGMITGESIAGELGDVVAGVRPGRESEDERILFWHRGLATTDIALGQAILDRAIEQDVGTMLPYR
jgi:ornithine cyclodeaminase/alanine dehydrogenase-like protein (mu-crystallin family)